MNSERRRAPRYPFIAEAEVTEIASGVKLRARTNDVSCNGCFLDMLNPSPQGAEILIRISHANATFTAVGRVVIAFPRLGVGVAFTNVDETQRAVLQEWLSQFSRGE